jgi:hypothetical protein
VRAVTNRNSDPPDSPSVESSLYELSLEDTLAQKMRGVPVKTRVNSSGYNPYDAMAPGKSRDAPRKQTDLRKLSEWIRLQRQVEELKKRDPEE